MDKTIIFAVAGSGKTSLLIDRLDIEKRTLIVTYTNSNYDNIKCKIIEKFGLLPANINLFTYFNFLYIFCYMPFLHHKYSAKGINFDPCVKRGAKGKERYIDGSNRLYSNRISKLLEFEKKMDDVTARISKYFDQVLIDEVQDFAGNDFNLLMNLIKINSELVCVGDFHQHTFDTSRDGPVNKSLHDQYESYIKKIAGNGYGIDVNTLTKSYRCSPDVCAFVSREMGIKIESHRIDSTEVNFIEDQEEADSLFENDAVIKLFYRESNKYCCFSNNWGNAKGEDIYGDVCVVLNPTTFIKYKQGKLLELAALTKNKLYVAITRTKRNLYFVPEELYKKHKGKDI